MFVKPSPGFTIRDPHLRDHLPPEGRDVPETPYWYRRLRDADVVAAEAPASPVAVAPVVAVDAVSESSSEGGIKE